MIKLIQPTTFLLATFLVTPVLAEETPTLEIVWPKAGTVIELGDDPEGVIGIVVKSNFKLRAAGQCGEDKQCGHIHLKIDPDGDSCNIPTKAYNSMNSDFGGDLVKVRFGHCPNSKGKHVIGVLLADDTHHPILVNGKPVLSLVEIETK